ncbi:hypothetical protein LR48_Vigan09g202300 [Vigna angularis]|uniref:Phospholipid/glycerol acyltransferase domain-containing protein n=1 Tax=Phaseolus angularis TaxID=3914 RepID=A0A0L9VFA2_PHAAN|nr:hypothetical protein LR48_Vigan09g202300 [Vigna angularis]
MVSSMELLRLANWVMNQVLVKSCYGVARKIKSHGFDWGDLSYKPLQQPSSFSDIVKCDLEGRGSQTLACGSIFRAFLLLCSCPILWFLNYEMKLRLMIFISFCGLKVKDMENTSRAVLPKFYLENLNLEAYEVVASVGSRVFFTTMPRVMVEGFLKEYLNADAVIATELHTSGSYFTGFLSKSGFLVKHSALKDYFGDTKPDLGIGNTSLHDQLFISLCKEAYVVMNEGKVMPRNKYPKPLVFHDGRLAFLPTPSATLCMFMWLPIGLVMAIYRIFLGVFLCCKFTMALGVWCGLKLDFKDNNQKKSESDKGVLYVCTHRTLLDPIFLSSGLGRPLTAVTYSLSKVSECIAPIRTIRLTRDRKEDGETMKRLLGEGDLVVFPEGTTCREPYLLRFSSLFAELADEIVPVAVNVHLSMFYGTTASGLKEAYVVMNEGKVMPRNKYPKPLVFHDGRLAFLPTPSATLCMFMWLPIGLVMAIYRIFLGVFLCCKFTMALGVWCGLKLDFKDNNQKKSESDKGVLYVCTHRTLLDPIFLSSGLGRPLTAVTYSLSKVSECIAPIRTIRLTRDRKEDGETMKRLLGEGDLVVFPEGTTCREPYLLRFSSLFAELADEIVPVAVNVHLSMFYGTTASGLKVLDPFFFFMNPSPKYDIEILEKVPKELTCAGGRSSHEVANHIQKQLGYALGFECTNLTRRDKYIMLAGNEGFDGQPDGQPGGRLLGLVVGRPSGASRPNSRSGGRPLDLIVGRPSGRPLSLVVGQPGGWSTTRPSGRPSGRPLGLVDVSVRGRVCAWSQVQALLRPKRLLALFKMSVEVTPKALFHFAFHALNDEREG